VIDIEKEKRTCREKEQDGHLRGTAYFLQRGLKGVRKAKGLAAHTEKKKTAVEKGEDHADNIANDQKKGRKQGRYNQEGGRSSYPLRFTHSRSFIGDRERNTERKSRRP